MLRAAEHVLKDFSYAARRLLRAPVFVIVSTVLIAVSLASNAVIFGLVDVLLLRTLPVRDAASLVQLFELRPTIPAQEYLSADLRDLIASEATTLTDVMGELDVTTTLEQEAATSSVDVGLVTPNYFEGLGIEALLGRNPGEEDDSSGNRIAVLSHRAWTRYFAQDRSIVGRTVRLGGQPYAIVGVQPEGFNGTSLDSGPDFRVLFANRGDFTSAPLSVGLSRILARLREGHSLESARAETRVIWSRFREEFVAGGGVIGQFDRDLTLELRSIANGTSRVREQFEGTLLLLFGGGGLVFALVCLNVGGLLLARVAQSKKDTAMRRALGATRGRIACQWVVESVLLAAIGGIAGLLLALGALPAVVRWLSPVIGFGGFGRAPALDVAFDGRIAAFGVAAMLGMGIVAALVPTLWWTRKDTYAALKASTDDRESRRIQSALSVVQIAISTVLVLGCGLMIRTLDRLDAVDAGFDRTMLTRFVLDPGLADYDGAAAAVLQQRLLEETARLPGVEAAAITQTPVMQGLGMIMVVAPEGPPPVFEGSWNTNVNRVTAGYFETMGIELLSGVVFEDKQTAADAPAPVVVNATFARRFFGEETAVDRVFDMGREFKTPRYRIVGVVSDANYRSLREANPPIFYVNPMSLEQNFAGEFSLLVRTTTPEGVIAPVSALVRSIDPALPVLEAVTMSDEVDRSLWRERLVTALTTGFAMIGLAIAAIGLYAILAHYVASRRKEIGLRIALGAMGGDVVRLAVRRVGPLVLLGLLAGTVAHVAHARWLATLLYEVSALDPIAFAVAAASLLLMSALAAMVPVLHAMSVDPAITLRED